MNVAASYFKPFNVSDWDMEFYSRFKYTKKDYATPALLYPAAHLRTDVKYNLYGVLSRNFSKSYFGSVSYNYIRNESNTDLYDFDKHVYGLSFGFKY